MVVVGGGASWAFWGGGRPILQPGRTTDDHHLISAACSACHTPFVGITDAACVECHRRELERDTHPPATFDDPRWAASREATRALHCVGCHREHQGAAPALRVDAAFCFPCHDDVVAKRPSHAELAPASCGNGGCHNYHDNSVLNEAFLRRELAVPVLASGPGLRAKPQVLNRPVRRGPPTATARVPPGLAADGKLVRLWRQSAHARAGVGCAGCHQPPGKPLIRRPTRAVCAECHAFAAATFVAGKHGVRDRVGLSPLAPGLARVSMRAPHPEQPAVLDCGSCHEPHRVDTTAAATSACLGCHADEHSLAFATSPHARQRDSSSPMTITCATCHLPRTTSPDRRKVVVEHGNTLTLRPRDHMLGPVCLDCHGLAFAMNSLYDDALVATNFRGRPSASHPTLALLTTTTPRETKP
jgi:predicted CXXCH cytochrome family protein